MAVSKMAVIAIVAILAVPILVGYGMNLQQVTHSDYKVSDDSVITTPLIQNDVAYTYAHADPYQLNTNTAMLGGTVSIPVYEKIGSVKTSFPTIQDSGNVNSLGSDPLSTYQYYYAVLNYDYTAHSIWGTVYANDGGGEFPLVNIPSSLYSFRFDNNGNSDTYVYTFYIYSGGQYHLVSSSVPTGHNITRIVYSTTTPPLGISWYREYTLLGTPANQYVDIAAGFHLNNTILKDTVGNINPVGLVGIKTPSNSRSALFTIDLDSVTDSNYNIVFGGINFEKTTVGGEVSWTATKLSTGVSYDLYYNPNITHNSYQMYMEIREPIPNTTKYNGIIELRYVGNWPTLIGEANTYMTYTFDTIFGFSYLANVGIGQSSSTISPTIRFDDAEFRAFEIPLIKDCTYDPASFRNNPSTTLTDLNLYGNSITFGGNTYTVSDGNITLGTHKVSLNGIKFESILNDNLTYDNRINGTIVSTTAAASTITFNGDWSFNISTSSMESYSYTSTEWIAGSFGWDGIDSSFLFVALIADLGIFIALAIYCRNTNRSLWPVLIVCGGAAFLIFCML